MENSPRLLEIEGAAERTGLYYTLINTYLAADEVAYIVANSRVQAAVQLGRSPAGSRGRGGPVPGPGAHADHRARRPPGRLGVLRGRGGRLSGRTRSRRDARNGHAVLLRHHRPAQGRPARPAGGGAERAAAGDGVRPRDVRIPPGHDLSQPGAAVPLSAAGERVSGDPARCHQRGDGALRRRAVAGSGRAVPGDPLPDGAGDVQPAAAPAGGRQGPLRHLLARVHRARRRTVPGARQAGDDRLARPGHHRVLRRHRGQRLHVLRLRAVARSSGHGRQDRSWASC